MTNEKFDWSSFVGFFSIDHFFYSQVTNL